MPNSLSIATLGDLPARTPFTISTSGLLDDPNAVAAAGERKRGGRQFHVEQPAQRQQRNPNAYILRDWNTPPAGLGTDAPPVDGVQRRTIDVDGEPVVIEIPAWQAPPAPLAPGAGALAAIADPLDRALAAESRAEAIRQHAAEVAASLALHKRTEDEAAVAVILLLTGD